MAGSSSQFNAAAFRKAIRTAMNIGLPPADADQPTFYFPVVTTVGASVGNVDGESVPFAMGASVTATRPAPVKVPCAIERGADKDDATDIGELAPDWLSLILLDDDYVQVKGFAYVVVGGIKYNYRHEVAPLGLFSVGVRTVRVQADDLR